MPSGREIAVFVGIIAVVLGTSRLTAHFLPPVEAAMFLREQTKLLWEGVVITAGIYFLPVVVYGAVCLIYRWVR